MRRLLLTLLLISLALTAAACGGARSEESSTATPVAAPAATSTPLPATDTPQPPTPTQMSADAGLGGDSSADVETVAVQPLETLDSYRARTQVRYEGFNDQDEPEQGLLEFVAETVRQPPARHLVMTTTDLAGQSEAPRTVEFYQIGETLYANLDGNWISTNTTTSPFSDPSDILMASATLLSDLEGVRRLQPDEEINGIDSIHYIFDERSLHDQVGSSRWLKATGQAWVAKEGGYLTRYALDATLEQGGSPLAPDLHRGALHIEFELSDVNAEIVIEAPEHARGGAGLAGFDAQTPFPLPEDGTIAMATATFTMIETALTVAEAQIFYEEALAALGWSKDEESSSSFEGLVTLVFNKEIYTLNLNIARNPGAPVTQVMADVEAPE